MNTKTDAPTSSVRRFVSPWRWYLAKRERERQEREATVASNALFVFVFDIDGTLSRVGDRIECLQREPKNWDEFYDRCDEDEPNVPVVEVCRSIWNQGHRVIYLTGRRESCRKKTMRWLGKLEIAPLKDEHLIMRPDNDHRHDVVLKPELLKKAGLIPFMIFDDRASMVSEWRRRGFPCCQVADGDF
jgi:hypothetical protein